MNYNRAAMVETLRCALRGPEAIWSAVAERSGDTALRAVASEVKAAWRFTSRRTPKPTAFAWSVGCAALFLTAPMLQAAESVGHIRGMVRDEQGAPLADVKVQMCGLEKRDGFQWRRELRTGEMPSYRTDKEGRFVVPVPVYVADMRFDFYCDKPGYAPEFLYGITHGSPELNVVLKRGLTVTGTVKRIANGSIVPVAAAQVELRSPYVDLWYQQRTMTDHDGRYTFQVTPPQAGRNWQVVFVGEVVPLVVVEGQPIQGPDFEVTVSVKRR